MTHSPILFNIMIDTFLQALNRHISGFKLWEELSSVAFLGNKLVGIISLQCTNEFNKILINYSAVLAAKIFMNKKYQLN